MYSSNSSEVNKRLAMRIADQRSSYWGFVLIVSSVVLIYFMNRSCGKCIISFGVQPRSRTATQIDQAAVSKVEG